jgi:hypothetical protein
MKLRLAPLIGAIGVVGVVWLSPPARPLNAGVASDLRNANCPQALVAPVIPLRRLSTPHSVPNQRRKLWAYSS